MSERCPTCGSDVKRMCGWECCPQSREIPDPWHFQALREYIQKRMTYLESEFKFDPHIDLDDWDTSGWSDEHQRAYGEYTALLKMKELT